MSIVYSRLNVNNEIVYNLLIFASRVLYNKEETKRARNNAPRGIYAAKKLGSQYRKYRKIEKDPFRKFSEKIKRNLRKPLDIYVNL